MTDTQNITDVTLENDAIDPNEDFVDLRGSIVVAQESLDRAFVNRAPASQPQSYLTRIKQSFLRMKKLNPLNIDSSSVITLPDRGEFHCSQITHMKKKGGSFSIYKLERVESQVREDGIYLRVSKDQKEAILYNLRYVIDPASSQLITSAEMDPFKFYADPSCLGDQVPSYLKQLIRLGAFDKDSLYRPQEFITDSSSLQSFSRTPKEGSPICADISGNGERAKGQKLYYSRVGDSVELYFGRTLNLTQVQVGSIS